MCVVSVTKSFWAEVQQLWVPASLFYKHRFSIDTEWSIFPKTVQIHLTSAQKKYCYFLQQPAGISVWAHSHKAEFTPRYMDSISSSCHTLTIYYTSQSLKSFSYCELKRCLHWKGVCIEKYADHRYSFTVTSKYTVRIELIQSINISSFYPHTHYYSQKLLQCIVANIRPNKDKVRWKIFSHWEKSDHHNVSSSAIPFSKVTSPGFFKLDHYSGFSRSQKNLPKALDKSKF